MRCALQKVMRRMISSIHYVMRKENVLARVKMVVSDEKIYNVRLFTIFFQEILSLNMK